MGAACVSGICQAPECATDDDCLNRRRCWEGDCRSDICEFKAECDAGLVCTGEPPTCKLPPARCASDVDCPLDTACRLPEQTCEPTCASDAACAAGEYCDGQFCRLRCSSAADCAAEDVCLDGRCEPDRCEDRTCLPDAPFVDPVSCDCVSCLTDRDCATERGERCSDQYACLFCVLKAEDSSVCSSQGLRLVDGCCVECAFDQQCPAGTQCVGGRCVVPDPRECVLDEECPTGSRCDLGWCVIPGSGSACTSQADCPSGEACYSDGRCRVEANVCEGCSDPNRCVAEPGDDVGTCAGCSQTCDVTGCPAGSVCYRPEDSPEGYCAPTITVDCP